MVWILFLVMLAGAFGCVAPSSTPPATDAGWPACAEGTVHDPSSGACVTALPLAANCGTLPDGGVVDGRCAGGLSCVDVGAAVGRCAKDCTAKDGCSEGRTCYARAGSTSGIPGFCGSAVGVGEHCDASALIFCSGDNLTCIAPSAGETAGKCVKYCDPRIADPNPECAQGESCADPFPDDPSLGVCVVPAGAYPSQCNHSLLVFCGNGDLCVRPWAGPDGHCHKRCTQDANCGSGQQCLSPIPGVSFCAAPVERCPKGDACASCAAEEDHYCGRADLCVDFGQQGTGCKADCSKAACPPDGTTCTALGASQACL